MSVTISKPNPADPDLPDHLPDHLEDRQQRRAEQLAVKLRSLGVDPAAIEADSGSSSR
jgi:hypothetical protein